MLKLGCAKADITPQFPVFMRGYADRNELSHGVEDRLSAGILLLEQAGKVILMLTIDSLGIGIRDCERVYRDIEAATGMDASHIYLACSHTHFAPGLCDCCIVWPDGKLPQGRYTAEKDYYPFFMRQILEGIKSARANLETVTVEETAILVPSVVFNRRTICKANGMVETNYLWPEKPDDFIFQPVDDEMYVWRFKTSGEVKAVLARFSCHPVTGGQDHYGISADFPGHFQSMIQREFHCPGFFLQGNSGDQVPRQRNGVSREDIAEILVRSIRMAERTFRPANEFRLEEKIVPVEVTLRIKCDRRHSEELLDKALEKNLGKKNFVFEELYMAAYATEFAATYPTDNVELPLRLLRLGSKVLVGMPFEVLSEIGIRLRKACPNTILTAITGGYEGYLPLSKEYRRGGYEVTLGPRFHKRAGEDFLKAAIQAVKEFEMKK